MKVKRPAPPLRVRTTGTLRNTIPRGDLFDVSDPDGSGPFVWQTHTCRRPVRYYFDLCDPCCDEEVEGETVEQPYPVLMQGDSKPEPCPAPAWNEAQPFGVLVPSDCVTLTLNNTIGSQHQTAAEILENTIDSVLAQHLQFGSGKPGDTTPTLLNSAVVGTDSAMSPAGGLGFLEDASTWSYGGMGGYLFGSASVRNLLLDTGLLIRTGSGIATAAGVPFIVGPGIDSKYGPATLADGTPATAAGPGEHWLYMVRSIAWDVTTPEHLMTTTGEGENDSAVDWELIMRNKFKQVTEMLAVIQLDPCGVYAVKIRDCGCC